MGEVIKYKETDTDKIQPVTGAGEYTVTELKQFDINNFVDFVKLNKEIKSISIPDNKDRLRVTIAIELHFVTGEKKHKYVVVDRRIKRLEKEKNKLGV